MRRLTVSSLHTSRLRFACHLGLIIPPYRFPVSYSLHLLLHISLVTGLPSMRDGRAQSASPAPLPHSPSSNNQARVTSARPRETDEVRIDRDQTEHGFNLDIPRRRSALDGTVESVGAFFDWAERSPSLDVPDPARQRTEQQQDSSRYTADQTWDNLETPIIPQGDFGSSPTSTRSSSSSESPSPGSIRIRIRKRYEQTFAESDDPQPGPSN